MLKRLILFLLFITLAFPLQAQETIDCEANLEIWQVQGQVNNLIARASAFALKIMS